MPSSRHRILFLTRNLPPLRGGMERLNFHILKELARDFEVRVCCPAECASALPPGVAAITAQLRPLPRFLAGTMLNALVEARRFRPHLVMAGSGLTAPLADLAARVCGARRAAYLHGLDIVADSRVYQNLWVRRFSGLDVVLVNSGHTATLAADAGVVPGRLRVLHPGVELPQLSPSATVAFRRDFDIGGRTVLLSLGRLTARKGLAEFLERAMPQLVAARSDLLLVVIGGEPVNSLKQAQSSEIERLSRIVERLSLQQHVRLLGEQDDATVLGAFQSAGALVFPVLDLPGDVEGFGMVAIEAAACGVPTAAFAVGGVVDAVSDPASGRLIRPGDYPAMVAALSQLLGDTASRELTARRCRDFAAGFEWGRFGTRLRAICSGLVADPATGQEDGTEPPG